MGEKLYLLGIKFFGIILFSLLFCILAIPSPMISVILLVIAMLLFGERILRQRIYFSIAIFVVALIIRLGFVLMIPSNAFSDYEVQLNAARELLSNGTIENYRAYFLSYGYQLGLVIWEMVFLKIWNSIVFLKILNAILSSGSVVLVYLITRELFSDKVARVTATLYCFYPFGTAFTSVLSNQHQAIFLTYLVYYIFFTKQDGKKKYAVMGVLLALANIIRPDAIISWVSLLAYSLFCILKEFKIKTTVKKRLTYLLIFFVFYISIGFIASQLIKISNLNPGGLKSNSGYWNIVVGLNNDTGGTWNAEDSQLIDSYQKQYNLNMEQAQLKIIKERLNMSIADKAELLVKKSQMLWWASSWYYALGPDIAQIVENHVPLWNYLQGINLSLEILVVSLAILGFIYKGKSYGLKVYLCWFAVFSFICVYIIWEVQPRYSFFIKGLFFILAGGGLEIIKRRENLSRNI